MLKYFSNILYEKHKSARLAKLSKLNQLLDETNTLIDEYEPIYQKYITPNTILDNYEIIRKSQLEHVITLNNIHILLLKIGLYGETYEGKEFFQHVSKNYIFNYYNKDNFETDLSNNIHNSDIKIQAVLTNTNTSKEQESISKDLIINSNGKIISLISYNGIMTGTSYYSIDTDYPWNYARIQTIEIIL